MEFRVRPALGAAAAAVLWMAGAAVPAPAAAAAELLVGTAGPTCVDPQYATIQAAVTAAAPGATIRVCAGTYPETVEVDKPLTFLGAQAGVDARTGRTVPAEESIVDSSTGGFRIQGGVANVTIDGFTIQNAGTPAQEDDGIEAFAGGSGYTFVDNIFTANTYGINFHSDGTVATLIRHNRFFADNQTGSAGGAGVFVSNGPANDTTITENSFSGHSSAAVNTTGSTADFSHDLLITDNTSTDDATFAVVVNARSTRVTGNVVTHTDPDDPNAGSAIFVGGNTDGLRIEGNVISGGAASGVRVTSFFGAPSTGLTITGNTISSRRNGVRFGGGESDGTIDANSVTGSSHDGILVESGTSGLSVTHNTAGGSAVLDCEDDTTGSGTAGTANTWTDDIGATDQPAGICEDAPALTITKAHRGPFHRGQRGATYLLGVADAAGAGPTNGTAVTVTDRLPRGLKATALAGPGWTCVLSTLTCTRADVLAAGSAYPPLLLTADVSRHAPRHVVNAASVTGGGDGATHTALDPTLINAKDAKKKCPRAGGDGCW
ncbi:right-handed parallel beta-helix repeat-containing protein [Streptomyces sp. NPDC048664]|uniref:right-handed parallel beta-helix repeat-containing protein n=1 Tax=Streptomyces sp. NPDC048664 TaxID=3154505 RepID=UPI003431F398